MRDNGNCVGLNGSSCGEDSQVPGIETIITSGQSADWNSGRGFRVADGPGTPAGGSAVGGADGVSGRRITITTIVTTSTTTSAIAAAAIRARMR